MRVATCKLKSKSPYCQGKYITEPRKDKESHRDHEARAWRQRMHVNERGNVAIPPMALKNCLSEVAKFLGTQIPGKGKATFTKHVEAGVLVTDPVDLGVKADSVEGEWRFVPSDGVRGSGKRVEKCFPLIKQWEGTATFYLYDDTVTNEVFEKFLREAGMFIGLGSFRPRNNGYYGRFDVESIEFSEA